MQHGVLGNAFKAFRARVAEINDSDDWAAFADLFTEDAVYRRRGHAPFEGREAIRHFIHRAMTTFPGTEMTGFEVVWRTLDERRGQVVYEFRNLMRDPGDGSVHAASTLSGLTYAGDGLWSRAEDIQNPLAYRRMLHTWMRAARALGTLGPEGEAFYCAHRG